MGSSQECIGRDRAYRAHKSCTGERGCAATRTRSVGVGHAILIRCMQSSKGGGLLLLLLQPRPRNVCGLGNVVLAGFVLASWGRDLKLLYWGKRDWKGWIHRRLVGQGLV